jgi:hypothetical protein
MADGFEFPPKRTLKRDLMKRKIKKLQKSGDW